MSVKWKKTNHVGVRYYEHPTRKNGVNFDRYFVIRYQRNGKRVEEGLGWASEKWTAEQAALTLADLKKAHITGEGPITLAEKRQLEEQRRVQEQDEAERLEKEGITFGQFFDETYFPLAESTKKPDTTRTEKIHFEQWLKPIIGGLPFREISPFHLEKVKKAMLDAALTPRSIQYCLATFRQCWNAARNNGLAIGETPSRKVKIPKIDNRRARFLTQEEADTLLANLRARSRQLHDIALLALRCGLRAGEIFNLTWGDVDLARDLIILRDTKSGKSRIAYMTKDVKAMFERMRAGGQNDLVFTVRRKDLLKKGEMRVKQVSNSFDRAITDLGFNKGVTDRRQRVVFHTLRHTFASWHVEAGTDLYRVKELMGHGTLAMTERYSHLSENTCRAAVRNLERAVSGRQGKVVPLGQKR